MSIINLQDSKLYYIGGVVRDELLGRESLDVDVTYEGNAVEFVKKLRDVEILQINEPFSTVKIRLENKEIDIASTRGETYPKAGHLPVVKSIGCSLKEDILRRDFTVNSLAKNTLTGEIIDYTGGLEDLKLKLLRVLHKDSFIEDPTRILRGLKFSVRFGFELEDSTRHLQEKYLDNVNYDMSYKRLKKELIETFNLNSNLVFEKFVAQRIYKLLTPREFSLPNVDFESLIKKYKPNNIWIIYVGQVPDVLKLPLTKQEKKIVEDFYTLKNKDFSTDFDIYKNFSSVSLETILMCATFNFSAVIKYLDILQEFQLAITGEDLMSLGILPGPKYQECFDYVLKKKLECPKMAKTDELNWAKKFFAS